MLDPEECTPLLSVFLLMLKFFTSLFSRAYYYFSNELSFIVSDSWFITRESICFSTLGESEILKAAEVEVYRGVYYDPSKKPIEHGLLDPHMVCK